MKLFKGNYQALFSALAVSIILLVLSILVSNSSLMQGFFGILVISIVYQIFLGLFDKHWADHHGKNALLVGFLFTALSFIISLILFRHTSHLIGLTTVFFTIILTLPILQHILRAEERLEKKKGHFFKKNENVIDFYLYFFLGVFAFFLVMSYTSPDLVFSKDDFYNVQPSTLDVDLGKNLPPPAVSDSAVFWQIVKNNLFIVFVTFCLSLLFGAGSIYLIVLNASMAAAAIAKFSLTAIGENAAFSFLCNWSVFSLHLIPEILAFLIAAIAGGLLLLDFKKEKLFSKNFDQVSLQSLKLLGVAIIVLLVAAFTEVWGSGQLIQNNVCVKSPEMFISIFMVLIIFIIWLEHHRRTHPKYHNKRKK